MPKSRIEEYIQNEIIFKEYYLVKLSSTKVSKHLICKVIKKVYFRKYFFDET